MAPAPSGNISSPREHELHICASRFVCKVETRSQLVNEHLTLQTLVTGLVAKMFTSGKARQCAAGPHFHFPPSTRSCLRSRSDAFRARPRGFQPILACNNTSAASTQQAGSLHPLIPTPNEVALQWLPASVLLMLRNFNVLGQFSEQLPVLGELHPTGMSHLCLSAAQFAIYYGGALLYITASVGMVHWYYCVTYHHAQHARGVTAMTAVLASAGIMVATLAYRMWPMLSVTAAHQAVSCKLAAA